MVKILYWWKDYFTTKLQAKVSPCVRGQLKEDGNLILIPQKIPNNYSECLYIQTTVSLERYWIDFPSFVIPVECMLHTVARDTVCRASATIDETLSYKSSSLKKINMAECQIHLSVCGRNRYSAKGIPVADVMIPMAAALKKQEAEWFSLDYKIDMPVTLCRERKTSQINRSFELKEGRNTKKYDIDDTR